MLSVEVALQSAMPSSFLSVLFRDVQLGGFQVATPMAEVAVDIFSEHGGTQAETHPSHIQSQSPTTDAQIHRGKWKQQICCSSLLEPSYVNFNCHLMICTHTHFFPQDIFC